MKSYIVLRSNLSEAPPNVDQDDLLGGYELSVLHSDHAAAVARLKEAGDGMEQFHRHHIDCATQDWDCAEPFPTCNCGASEALAAWRKAKESA